jgi:hypothetical protein
VLAFVISDLSQNTVAFDILIVFLDLFFPLFPVPITFEPLFVLLSKPITFIFVQRITLIDLAPQIDFLKASSGALRSLVPLCISVRDIWQMLIILSVW